MSDWQAKLLAECQRELATAIEDRDMARANERSALSAYDSAVDLAEDLRSELATVTSERDFLVERLRELASEWRGAAGLSLYRAAVDLEAIVTEATTGRSVTATQKEETWTCTQGCHIDQGHDCPH